MKRAIFLLLYISISGTGTHDIWKSDWGNEAFFSGHSNNNEEIRILLNPNYSFTVRQHTQIMNESLQALDLLIHGKEIKIVIIYGPNNDDVTLFNS